MTTAALEHRLLVEGTSWSDLLRKYNPAAGTSGGLVLAASAAMPALIRLRRARA